MDPKDEGNSAINRKEILRQKILTKRKDRGEEDIDTGPEKIIKHELTPEDIEKRDKRKEQNRKAATKFRNKKKIILDLKQQERTDLINSNTKLQLTITELSKELDKLKDTYNRHLESGCCLRSGHSSDHQESNTDTPKVDSEISGLIQRDSCVNPETAVSSPGRPVLNSVTHFLNPDTPCLNTDTPCLNPDTPYFTPVTSCLNPDILCLNPVTPDLNPDTSGLNPDTPDLNLDAIEINPETISSQNIIGLLADLLPNDLEMLANSTNPQPQVFHVNSVVNNYKMPIASPNHDLLQHQVDCCLNSEYDMSFATQNDQLSMFQNTPVIEEPDDPWSPSLPNDDSLEHRSFINL